MDLVCFPLQMSGAGGDKAVEGAPSAGSSNAVVGDTDGKSKEKESRREERGRKSNAADKSGNDAPLRSEQRWEPARLVR